MKGQSLSNAVAFLLPITTTLAILTACDFLAGRGGRPALYGAELEACLQVAKLEATREARWAKYESCCKATARKYDRPESVCASMPPEEPRVTEDGTMITFADGGDEP